MGFIELFTYSNKRESVSVVLHIPRESGRCSIMLFSLSIYLLLFIVWFCASGAFHAVLDIEDLLVHTFLLPNIFFS